MPSTIHHQVKSRSGRLHEQEEQLHNHSFCRYRTQLGQGDGKALLPNSYNQATSVSLPVATLGTSEPVERRLLTELSRQPSTERRTRQLQLQVKLKKFQKALATAQAKNNRANQVNLLKRIGLIHCQLSEYAWGIKCLKQALHLAQTLENQVSVGVILNYLGAAYRQIGQEHKALRVYLRALAIVQDIGNEAGVALLLNHLGDVYNSLGQSAQALSCSRQALEKFQDLGNFPDGEGAALHNIGEIYLQMNRPRQAMAFFEQAFAIYQKISNGTGEAKILESMATAYVRLDQEPQALEFYQRALEIRRQVGHSPNTEARSFDYIGAVHYKMGNCSRALWYHLQALGILQAVNCTASFERFDDETAGVKKLLQNLLPIYDRLGLHQEGVKCYQDAVEIVQTFGEQACEEAIGNFLNQPDRDNF